MCGGPPLPLPLLLLLTTLCLGTAVPPPPPGPDVGHVAKEGLSMTDPHRHRMAASGRPPVTAAPRRGAGPVGRPSAPHRTPSGGAPAEEGWPRGGPAATLLPGLGLAAAALGLLRWALGLPRRRCSPLAPLAMGSTYGMTDEERALGKSLDDAYIQACFCVYSVICPEPVPDDTLDKLLATAFAEGHEVLTDQYIIQAERRPELLCWPDFLLNPEPPPKWLRGPARPKVVKTATPREAVRVLRLVRPKRSADLANALFVTPEAAATVRSHPSLAYCLLCLTTAWAKHIVRHRLGDARYDPWRVQRLMLPALQLVVASQQLRTVPQVGEMLRLALVHMDIPTTSLDEEHKQENIEEAIRNPYINPEEESEEEEEEDSEEEYEKAGWFEGGDGADGDDEYEEWDEEEEEEEWEEEWEEEEEEEDGPAGRTTWKAT
eukprot:EG_transcript_11085